MAGHVQTNLQDPMKPVRFWLYGVAFLVALMVLVGGATRLTDSGLSITEWAPISGAIPPLSPADWAAEFLKYQTTTEFQTINKDMNLEQFKVIYWWEWGHRFLGRLIGFAVIVPLIYFWVRKRLTPRLKPALVGLVILGGFQGFIGWWMVKSGLVDRVDVSQVRLAVHLTLACIIFVWTIWLARSVVRHSQGPIYGVTWQGGGLVVLVLVQVFIGGLVAGLDAGMAFNTWPKMDGSWVPGGLWTITPVWQNLTDNAMTVQFFHRIAAYVLWLATILHAIAVWKSAPGTTHARRAAFLAVLVSLQALLGIVTLMLQVPVSWALAHQSGAVVVLAFATAHWRALKPSGENAFNIAPLTVNPVHGQV